MNMDVIGFPVSLLFLLVIIYWFMIHVKGKVLIKACIISSSCFFFILTWQSINNLKGWSASYYDIPEKFAIHWIVIDEPSKRNFAPGGIYLLMSDLNTKGKENITLFNRDNRKEPRLYKFQYSKELHEKMQKMLKGIKSGKKYMGVRKKRMKHPKLKPVFYELPKPQPPKK